MFGAKRRAKERPFIVVSVSECKAWAEEIKRRVGFVDDPDASLFKESERLLQAGGGDEPTEQEAKEAGEFAERDPKDKGNRKVRYRKERSTIDEDYKQQDMLYLLTELKAAMVSLKRPLLCGDGCERESSGMGQRKQDLEIEGGEMMFYANGATI